MASISEVLPAADDDWMMMANGWSSLRLTAAR